MYQQVNPETNYLANSTLRGSILMSDLLIAEPSSEERLLPYLMELNPKSIKEKLSDGLEVLKNIVHYRTYPIIKSDGKKETREEVIDRLVDMHVKKFPELEFNIQQAFEYVYAGKVVPSMRSMQFGGTAIERSNARMFNCSYTSLSEFRDFSDLMWLAMNGVGTGYSVQKRHIDNLPIIESNTADFFVIPDDKEGWADSIKYLLYNPYMEFAYDLIRGKGATLSTGGTSSGSDALKLAHERIREVLLNALGRRLTSIETFDIMCHSLDAVVVGGVRRSASICLFDADDEEMLTSKSNEWHVDNPQRARANISAVVLRDENESKNISNILDFCFASNSGEPGVFLTNDLDYGTNPCAEIALEKRGLCNLTEINISAIEDETEFLQAVRSATFIGTLQAAYTDFHYIHPDWSKNAQRDALLGVSLTGQAQAKEWFTDYMRQTGAWIANKENAKVAEMIGINRSKRITTTKPSGTTSAWLGTTSGIHSAHAPYYLRRVRLDRKDPFSEYLLDNFGEADPETYSFIETDKFSDENIIVTVPIAMTDAIYRNEESSIDLLERMKSVYNSWIKLGHNEGANTHNISLTVSYKDEEKEDIKQWMIDNSASYSGISLIPFDGGTYTQAPFEEITKQEYEEWTQKIPSIDFSSISYSGSIDERISEASCFAGQCEVL